MYILTISCPKFINWNLGWHQVIFEIGTLASSSEAQIFGLNEVEAITFHRRIVCGPMAF